MQEENMVQKRLEVKQDEKKVYDIVLGIIYRHCRSELVGTNELAEQV